MSDSENDEWTCDSVASPELVPPKEFVQRQFALTKRTLEATETVLAESQELEALRIAAERCEAALASGDSQLVAEQVSKCRQAADAAGRANCRVDDPGPLPKYKPSATPVSLRSWRPSFKETLRSASETSILEPPGALNTLAAVGVQAELGGKSEDDAPETSSGKSESQDSLEQLDEESKDDSKRDKMDSGIEKAKALGDQATREERYQDGLIIYTDLLSRDIADGKLRAALLCNAALCSLKTAPDQANWARATQLLRSTVAWTREALQIDPDNAKTHFRLGCALESLERFREAYIAYSAAADLVPEDSRVRQSLARISRYSEQELGPEITSLLRHSKDAQATQQKAERAAAKKEHRTRFQRAVAPEGRVLPQLEPQQFNCCYCRGSLKGHDGYFARPCGHGPFCVSCCRQIDGEGHELPLCPICKGSTSSTSNQCIIAEWVAGSQVEPHATQIQGRRKKFGPRRPPDMAAEAARKQQVFPPRIGPEDGVDVKQRPLGSSFLACLD